LWNQVQGLSASVSNLIILVTQVLAAQGRHVRQSDDNLGNWLNVITTQAPALQDNMTALESECIVAMEQAYAAIYPCCQPSKDCNETYINSTSYLLSGFQSQLEAIGNITQAFNNSFWIVEAKIGDLDQNCGNMGLVTAVPTTAAPTTAAPTTAAPSAATTMTVAPTTAAPSTTVAAPTVKEVVTTSTTVSTTTTYQCCPEYPNKHDCEALCLLNSQVGTLQEQIAAILAALNGKKLRMRQARSAVDLELEGSLLDSLKEAFVVSENCVNFNICNGSHAVEISRNLNNIGEFFMTNGLTNLSEGFSTNILNLFGKIHDAVQKNLENKEVLDCPNWILTLGLDDALMGSLCLIFSDSSLAENRYRRETRTECTNEYIDVMEELFEATKDFLGSKVLDLKLSKDLYMKLVQLHPCADLAHVSAARATKLNQLQELFRQLHN